MKNIILIIITATVVGAIAFWGGTYYQQQQFRNRAARFAAISPEQFQNRRGGPGLFGRGSDPIGGRRINGSLNGRLDKVDDNAITITTRFGSQKITLDAKTKVNIAAPADRAKLKTGSDLVIKIKRLSDGTLKADNITQTN